MLEARSRADYYLDTEVDTLQLDIDESLDNAEYIGEACRNTWEQLPT